MGRDTVVRGYDEGMYDAAVREYYDHSDFLNYGYWEATTRSQKSACESLCDKLLEALPHRTGRILDVACGKGATTRHVRHRRGQATVIGVNLSEKQLETSRRNAPDCHFAAMDAARLGFEDETFDHVICVEAALHFHTREQFLREALRVLKPGGTLALSDILFARIPGRRNRWIPAENLVTRFDQYEQVFQRVGFRDIRLEDATDRCWRPFRRNLLRWSWRKLVFRELGVRTFMPGLLYWTAVGVLLKSYVLVSATKPSAKAEAGGNAGAATRNTLRPDAGAIQVRSRTFARASIQ